MTTTSEYAVEALEFVARCTQKLYGAAIFISFPEDRPYDRFRGIKVGFSEDEWTTEQYDHAFSKFPRLRDPKDGGLYRLRNGRGETVAEAMIAFADILDKRWRTRHL